MQLIDQHTKKIMEGCKERAKDAGLRFHHETLEYVVSNRDLLELAPKMMIPTLYDYWIQDVEVLKEKGRYELYPANPYETVINTRPAISFYNDNNPDWLNVMIFYHVLAHIDFFQNNLFFRHTWDDDFTGRALSDKRLIAKLRSEKGRWVDYVIEFARSIDNLVGYHDELSRLDRPAKTQMSKKVDFYFDIFLQSHKKASFSEYMKEIDRYNDSIRENKLLGEEAFFYEVVKKHPEFEAVYKKSLSQTPGRRQDLMEYLMEHSHFLNREENKWMKSVIQVVRNTSLFFQPQIRTKIMNEGWASFWHETLFLEDDRISGHEVDFARVNAGVTSLPKIGLNPYALGMLLFNHIEEASNKGRYSFEFLRLTDVQSRDRYDTGTGAGRQFIFKVREHFCDFTFINAFLNQDFVNRNNLFVAGRRLNQNKMVWEYFIKSRRAEDYREMMLDVLYHPPHIELIPAKSNDHTLYLYHHFEGKPLVREFIPNTMIGIEYLWGGPVKLETSEIADSVPSRLDRIPGGTEHSLEKPEVKWQRVLYTVKDRKLTRELIK
ncbi:MAG: SpoVR family protein [Deltaproteobacteria bacterium]|nr:SpoVR family protein [Deltaproteobacteria bacterium]MBW1994144.1 SpoVR family protein [Deltaproteobacteria bacterium]MBW2150950.1 SpoVR family protein [Deltaproteobacteria bacterium]